MLYPVCLKIHKQSTTNHFKNIWILLVRVYDEKSDTRFSLVVVVYFQLFLDFSNRIHNMYPVWVVFLIISNFLGLFVLSDSDFLRDDTHSPRNTFDSFSNLIWRNKLRKLIFSQTGYEKYRDFGIRVKNADNF